MWGKHLILDGFGCCSSAIRNRLVIDSFARSLVSKIDMVAYGDPMIHHFGIGDKSGYTLVQLIETSNITAHFCEESGDMYLDVFSCKDFLDKDVEIMVHSFFKPSRYNIRVIERGSELK
jgi:S-adenosylmethionine/arginine decarboxylase-like enzyme